MAIAVQQSLPRHRGLERLSAIIAETNVDNLSTGALTMADAGGCVGKADDPHEKTNSREAGSTWRLWFVAGIAALCGCLFGMDLGTAPTYGKADANYSTRCPCLVRVRRGSAQL